MKTYKPLLWLFLLAGWLVSCEKEHSYEKGADIYSIGSLQSDVTGDCLGNSVSGTYKQDTALNSSNYVDISVNVTSPGSFIISSDTINNIYFRAAGSFTTAGINNVRLVGYGTPQVGGTNIFTVTYDSSQCTFSVNTLAGGTGGTSVFTLAGSPSACTGASVQGILTAGTAAGSGNTATIQVDVTTAGTYSISTSSVDGIIFSGSGTLASTGTQSITLTASGTPTNSGSFNVPIGVGSSNCSFPVTVVAASPATYTLNGSPGNCTGATVQGTYVVGTALNVSNTATIQVNVTAAGSYSISTSAVNGISFSGSGIFSSTGLESVVLTGNGTPTTAGNNDIPITVGSSSCDFNVTVDTAQTYNFTWQFTVGSVTYGGPSFGASVQTAGTTNTFIFQGNTPQFDSTITLGVINSGGQIQTGVNYNTNATGNVSTAFSFLDASLNTIYQADATKAGVNIVLQITNYDQTNMVVQGTFSGTAKDASNNTITITNGSFTAQLQ